MDAREPASGSKDEFVIEFPDDPAAPDLPDVMDVHLTVEPEHSMDRHWEIADLGIPRDQG